MLQILKLRMSDDGKGIYVKGTLALEYREMERMTAVRKEEDRAEDLSEDELAGLNLLLRGKQEDNIINYLSKRNWAINVTCNSILKSWIDYFFCTS